MEKSVEKNNRKFELGRGKLLYLLKSKEKDCLETKAEHLILVGQNSTVLHSPSEYVF